VGRSVTSEFRRNTAERLRLETETGASIENDPHRRVRHTSERLRNFPPLAVSEIACRSAVRRVLNRDNSTTAVEDLALGALGDGEEKVEQFGVSEFLLEKSAEMDRALVFATTLPSASGCGGASVH
jgi:hypothetical protein